MEPYKFNPEQAFNAISDHWKKWAAAHGVEKWVVGISGGKDSTVVAALASKIFGVDNVLGIMMPNGEQKDISDSKEVCKFLGIKSVIVNIGKAFEELQDEIVYEALQICGIEKPSAETLTNMPPRLRMTVLYAIAQSMPRAMVLNTSNLSEDVVGYASLWGDDTGSYAPIQGLTVTEVIALGNWLGLPSNLTHKTPIDGLQPKTDEEKLGFTYADLDRYIREDVGTPELKAKVDDLYRRNKFKTDMVRLPGPNFFMHGLLNYVALKNRCNSKEIASQVAEVIKCEHFNSNCQCSISGKICCYIAIPFVPCKAKLPKSVGNFVRDNNLPDAEKTDKQAFAENPNIVRLEPEPRYPEDGKINGEYDDNDNPKMPFMVADEKAQDGWVWKLDVNIKTGEVIGWPRDVKAEVHYKVCDCCRIKYAGKEYYEYVPDFLEIDDEGYGDYIILTIDDGKIVNWSEGKCRKFLETEMK